ncbi:MAG TPA: hypothetical protein VGM62_17665, partial [Chthoniobacterales bacterium]
MAVSAAEVLMLGILSGAVMSSTVQAAAVQGVALNALGVTACSAAFGIFGGLQITNFGLFCFSHISFPAVLGWLLVLYRWHR